MQDILALLLAFKDNWPLAVAIVGIIGFTVV
jgi:hypothetical protein